MRTVAACVIAFLAGIAVAILPTTAVIAQALLVALGTVAVVALCCFAVVWLRRRGVLGANTHRKPVEGPDTPDTHQHAYSSPAVDLAATQKAYHTAALQLAVISMYKGKSCSSRTLYPYITENRRIHWSWFISRMETLGFVTKHRQKGYIWSGSYHLFADGVLNQSLSLHPYPDLPAPVIRWISGLPNTLGAANAEDTLDAVMASPGGVVFRSNMA